MRKRIQTCDHRKIGGDPSELGELRSRLLTEYSSTIKNRKSLELSGIEERIVFAPEGKKQHQPP